jgi:uncharacterized tellurite resistance protein B-like protein
MGGSFATHPTIDERIRRVHPRFRRDEYRASRKGVHERSEFAVIDGSGNVVKVASAGAGGLAAAAALVAAPTREHLDHAARLIAAIPLATRERLKSAAGASQVVLALELDEEPKSRQAALAALEARRGAAEARAVAQARDELGRLRRAFVLPLIEMALPALKPLKQKERDALVQDLQAMVESDQRVSLSELVLLTFVRQHLREGAGQAVRSQYDNVGQVAGAAHAVLSLVAHAARGDTAAGFAAGKRWLGIELPAPLPAGELSAGRVTEALERLRVLSPLERPRIVRACLDCAAADGRFNIAEAELVRTVAAALDCPLPPMLQALDPATLAA